MGYKVNFWVYCDAVSKGATPRTNGKRLCGAGMRVRVTMSDIGSLNVERLDARVTAAGWTVDGPDKIYCPHHANRAME